MRDRLTVGCDALNVVMLVRFQLPQLRTEVIRPDEDTVLNTVGRLCDLWVRVPRLPPRRAHGPTGRHKLRTLEIWVRFPVSPLTVPWSNGNDSCPTNRKRWFNSIRDYSGRAGSIWKHVSTVNKHETSERFQMKPPMAGPGTPIGRATWLKPKCLQVRILRWAHAAR